MTWEQLSINKPHLVYIILGGFTSLFMLCSSVIKERLYIGEATVATLCGIIFGPHAAGLIDPGSWGNVDQITEEFSRIVLVVQCFAVGVELPKAYMERHWRSVTFLLVPVMTFGWMITSLFIWAVFSSHLSWLDSLTIAACVTATDPVLASSVVGKGKFAKRVPKHLRDLLSAESGCNDGMAFPFIYLALYIIRYQPDASKVTFHWFCYTILYECVFGSFYGVMVGYLARRAIRFAHERDLIDRESFLVFYFVLALFCAGSGSILGIDDLLVGFACGVGFSNDGWFQEETEESAVSNVIDLLINLAFFVYFGTIIPWEQYNSGYLGLNVWRLVVIGLLVLFFRRIPIMMALAPIIPDIKNWREALFAGHFGPIGVGAIFVAILARAELESESTTPLSQLPSPEENPDQNVIYLVWPIVTFLVICSIVVHGSSIAVFTLGKHINTLTITMSYTKGNEQPMWMDRLPRIQSRSKSSMSIARSDLSLDEKPSFPPGVAPFTPGTFLRRQKEEDNPSRAQSRASSRHRSRKGRNWDSGIGPGGPISQSAISPAPRHESLGPETSRSDSETLAIKSDPSSNDKASDLEEVGNENKNTDDENPGEIYEEGGQTVYEDEEGNVLAVEDDHHTGGQQNREDFEKREGRRLMHAEHADENHGVAPTKDDPNTDPGHEVMHRLESAEEEAEEAVERPGRSWRNGLTRMSTLTGIRMGRESGEPAKQKQETPKETRGPARAYQYGNTIIVEDGDGEVIKKYDIPAGDRRQSGAADPEKTKRRITQMSKLLGMGHGRHEAVESGAVDPLSSTNPAPSGAANPKASGAQGDDDSRIRFTITQGGRRMSKAEFIDQIRTMDPKSRVQAVEDSNAPEPVKREARKEAREQAQAHGQSRLLRSKSHADKVPVIPESSAVDNQDTEDATATVQQRGDDSDELHLVDSEHREIPFHDISSHLRRFRMHGDGDGSDNNNHANRDDGETAAERRRRQALQRRPQPDDEEDSEDDGTERVPPKRPIGPHEAPAPSSGGGNGGSGANDTGETAAERRRREGALGIRATEDDSSDSEDDNQPREAPRPPPQQQQRTNIGFVDEQNQPSRERGRTTALKWGKNVRR